MRSNSIAVLVSITLSYKRPENFGNSYDLPPGETVSYYIDDFVHPIPRNKVELYQTMAQSIGNIWKAYGAIEDKEFLGDDMHLEGTRSFHELLTTTADEVVIFGWVAFESKAIRDEANKKIATDPRVAELMSGLDSGFDGQRMGYGGFMEFIK